MLKQHGAVYLNAIGGAAQFYARCIDRMDGVFLMESGTPEAMWHLQLRDFPAIVYHGRPATAGPPSLKLRRGRLKWHKLGVICKPKLIP